MKLTNLQSLTLKLKNMIYKIELYAEVNHTVELEPNKENDTVLLAITGVEEETIINLDRKDILEIIKALNLALTDINS